MKSTLRWFRQLRNPVQWRLSHELAIALGGTFTTLAIFILLLQPLLAWSCHSKWSNHHRFVPEYTFSGGCMLHDHITKNTLPAKAVRLTLKR